MEIYHFYHKDLLKLVTIMYILSDVFHCNIDKMYDIYSVIPLVQEKLDILANDMFNKRSRHVSKCVRVILFLTQCYYYRP